MKIYNATFDQTIKPLAFIPNMDWMSPPAKRGVNPLLPKGHEYAFMMTDLEDIKAIVDEAKRIGAEIIILDYEGWSQSPEIYATIASHIRYAVAYSNLRVSFYPGNLGIGFTHDSELAEFLDGKPQENNILENIAKASLVHAACTDYTPDSYAYTPEQLKNGVWKQIRETNQKFRDIYYPKRNVIPFAAAHYGLVPGNPSLTLEELELYVQIIKSEEVILWGPATQQIGWLRRLLMGEPKESITLDLIREFLKV